MNQDEHDQLWELLGKAREPKASPFFASKVMRAIREPQPERVTVWAWLRQKWIVPVSVVACAAVAAIALLNTSVPTSTTSPQSAKAVRVDPLAEMATVIAANDEFETSLSDLLATEDNAVWLAADPSSLF
jgi:uncharacterized protein involved in exopolysaccharide biosynthesis